MTRVLAAIDASAYAPSICDHAAWFAQRLGAQVTLLHVMERGETTRARIDLSGSVGLGASETLLEELTRLDEAQARIAQEHGRALLQGAARRLRAAGAADIVTLHRHGEAAETIIELEQEADLVIIGKRGESGNFAEGHLGSKVERVARASVRPILAAPRVFMPVTRLVVAFDGGVSALKALQFASANAGFADLPVHVVVVGWPNEQTQRILASAHAILGARTDVAVERLEGDTETALQSALREKSGDVLLMGAYGHSRIRELIGGSTTTTMLRTCKLPLLLFR
jgi:nucleotide-binding universal stress UspA family protein